MAQIALPRFFFSFDPDRVAEFAQRAPRLDPDGTMTSGARICAHFGRVLAADLIIMRGDLQIALQELALDDYVLIGVRHSSLEREFVSTVVEAPHLLDSRDADTVDVAVVENVLKHAESLAPSALLLGSSFEVRLDATQWPLPGEVWRNKHGESTVTIDRCVDDLPRGFRVRIVGDAPTSVGRDLADFLTHWERAE